MPSGQGHYYIAFGRWVHHIGIVGLQDRSRLALIDARQNARSYSERAPQNWKSIMDVVVRTYKGKGSKELFSLLEKNKADIEKLMRSVKGFESYTLARSSDGEGGLSMTVCQDKAGSEEGLRFAKEWLSKNAADIAMDAPKVSTGSTIIYAMKH